MERGSVRLRAALGMAAEWQTARSPDELAREVCVGLERLVPGDGVAWNEVDLEGRTIRIVASPADYLPGDEQALAELIDENPLVENRSRSLGAAHMFSDFIGVREFHRRQIYCDVFGPAGVEDQLGAFFAVGPDTVVGVACNRGARTFTCDDRTLLDALLPHLRNSYLAVVERREAKARLDALERGLEASGQGVAILGPDGTVTAASHETEKLLRAWFPDDAPRPGTHTREHVSLRVRRVDGDPPLLVLEEHRRGLDRDLVRALGLTRQEAVILTLAARGLTDNQIAAELTLSPRTIQKHLEHVYRKLGVHNRTQAAARLLASTPHEPGPI